MVETPRALDQHTGRYRIRVYRGYHRADSTCRLQPDRWIVLRTMTWNPAVTPPVPERFNGGRATVPETTVDHQNGGHQNPGQGKGPTEHERIGVHRNRLLGADHHLDCRKRHCAYLLQTPYTIFVPQCPCLLTGEQKTADLRSTGSQR